MIITKKPLRAAAALILALVACRGEPGSETGRVALGAAPADTMVVYKTPTCGCCSKWVDHVEGNGFAVVAHDIDNAQLDATKRQLGVPAGRVSCHTATIGGYTIEGHVPADVIQRLLAEKPRGVRGLTVPGMPMGSPGMEGLISQEYEVLAFDEAGNVEVYARR